MSDAVERLRAELGDRYVIEREIGTGGMATVYVAHDVRHDRKVALKVLRPDLAAVIGAERFLTEIKTTANLQHPHILPLHDSGEAGGHVFYVMPYIEGESLRDRLTREKQLPVADAMRIAGEVADALDYAHRRGVIHRDVKPENLLLHDGRALVADFGIALAVTSAGGTRMTETGMSLGTPHYMSPEQAMGERDLDARTDVYALGCVLYEMLCGEPPFDGPTAQSIVAKVMTAEPERVTTYRKTVPPHVEAAVETALQKLPADRFASANDFAEALARPGLMGVHAGRSATRARAPWVKDWRSIAAIAIGALGLLFGLLGRAPTEAPPAPVVRFQLGLPEDRRLVSQYSPVAIAPDGARFAYVGVGAEPGAPRRLYVRAFDQLSPQPLPDTDGGGTIFFSPDGNWLGFWVGDQIRKIPVDGGPAVTVVPEARQFFGSATWTDDGHIVYPRGLGVLAEIPDGGGEATTIYADSAFGVYHPMAFPGSLVGFVRLPMSPSGTADFDKTEIVVVDRRTGETASLLAAPSLDQFAYAPSGHLVFLVDDVLYAAPFDIDRIEIAGPSVPVREGVQRFALSRSGTLMLVVSDSGTERELRLVDRAGRDTLLADQRRDYLFPRFSPDGRKVAVEIHDEAGGHIWVYDRDAGTLARLTTEGHNSRPVWSPDGNEVAYASVRDSLSGIYRMNADGGDVERPLGRLDAAGFTDFSWSPDGARVAFERYTIPESSRDIMTVAVAPDSVARALALTPANEQTPAYSPDGRWIAYVSDESGRREVQVRASSGEGGRFIVSTDGGDGPQWAGTRNELFYIGNDGWLWAATLEFEPQVRVVGRERLFDTAPYDLFSANDYGVHPSGLQFVFVQSEGRESAIELALNWLNELSQLVRAAE